jgi:hypothetical protein
MRTWVKVTIGAGVIVVLGVLALAGMGAYFVFRHLDTRSASELDARREFDAVRTRFGARPPLIEIVNPKAADIRVNRLAHPEGRRGETMHVLTWNAHDHEVFRTNVPVWLMRFSTLNILSQLGVAPSKFRLTVEDLKRYGPGIVVDYRPAAGNYVLIWLE